MEYVVSVNAGYNSCVTVKFKFNVQYSCEYAYTYSVSSYFISCIGQYQNINT